MSPNNLGRWLLILGSSFLSLSVSTQLIDDHDFLPVDEAYPTEVELTTDGKVLARWQMPAGYYLYKHAVNLVGKEGTELGTVSFPKGILKNDEYFGEVEVYYHFLEVATRVLSQTQAELIFDVHFQGCADAGLCYPPEVREFRLAGISNDAGSEVVPNRTESATAESSLLVALGSALLAGLILNLMPCVFPVLSIKAISMLQSTADSGHVRHAMAYLIGVVATFLLLSLILLTLRGFGTAVGWGFQLQSPGFVVAMALLFFLMSMNMLGFIEIPGFGVSMGQTNSFITGVLAVIIATPCTVPFMAVAIGYAVTQGGVELALIMAMMGLGMALPYVVVTASPGVASWLPRPGPWMQTIKRIMSIPLILTVIWLVWVLVRQVGYGGVIWAVCAMVAMAAVAFVGRSRVRWLATVWTVMLVVVAGTVYGISRPNDSSKSINARGFDLAAFTETVANNRPIFLNVTADWCLTCLANERTTLSRSHVMQEFDTRDITYVKVDWTNRDEEVTQLLEQFGRYGVPMYVYFARQGEPVVLPQILTPGLLTGYLGNEPMPSGST